MSGTPKCSGLDHDNSLLCPEVVWDLFESAEAAEAVIERTIQLEQVNECFMIWAKRVTEELEQTLKRFWKPFDLQSIRPCGR